ncbi:hypothetical protein CYMTET_36980 [Cymbomonas tetramitiformis]|uniref:Uncharacterized protein n=1 Tax=Cymbomonas tetramitiformis TaxID=36881 RepID=A0AAE0CEW3_9CHLO|nr:hypothetical protein CYMTET_36980 [Cymbomonas tetramitiformis]
MIWVESEHPMPLPTPRELGGMPTSMPPPPPRVAMQVPTGEALVGPPPTGIQPPMGGDAVVTEMPVGEDQRAVPPPTVMEPALGGDPDETELLADGQPPVLAGDNGPTAGQDMQSRGAGGTRQAKNTDAGEED